MKRRVCFTSPAGPLLNLAFAAFLGWAGWAWGGAVPGFPGWAYLAMALVFLSLVPSGFRWMVLDDRGVTVRNWRIRVRMDYPQIEEILVLPRRISLLTKKVVHYAALRSSDGRKAWIASWNFAFSRACLRELARRIEKVRGRLPRLRLPPSEPPPMTRSPLTAAAGGILAAAGLGLLLVTVSKGLELGRTAAAGLPGKARVLSLEPGKESFTLEVVLERIPGGERRKVRVRAAWAQGRKPGDVVSVKVHPSRPEVFLPADEGALAWSAFDAAFLALVLLALGGRAFIRTLTLPVDVAARLEEAFGASPEENERAPGEEDSKERS